MASSRNAVTGRPTNYANEKLPMLRSRGPILSPILDRFVPVAFRGCDPEFARYILSGFTSFSMGWDENTTDGDAEQDFHEVGLFQVPAGPRSGPAPNANPRADDNAYGRLATSAIVRRMLSGSDTGRAALITPGAWKPRNSSNDPDCVRAREDQVAVGLANLLEDEAAFRTLAERYAPGSAGSTSGWSLYRFATMFTAMSRGPTGAFNRFKPYLRELARTNEPARASRLTYLLADGISRRDPHSITPWKPGVAYGWDRTWQKILSGREFCRAMGGNTAAFSDANVAPEVEILITNVGYSRTIVNVAADTARAAVSIARNTASDVASAAAAAATDPKKVIAAVALTALAGGAIIMSQQS